MTKPRVVIVEGGAGFGGAIVSLSKIVRSLGPVFDFSTLVLFSDETTERYLQSIPVQFDKIRSYRRAPVLAQLLSRLGAAPVLRRLAAGLLWLAEFPAVRLGYHRLRQRIAEMRPALIVVNNAPHPLLVRALMDLGIPTVVHARGFPGAAQRIPNLTVYPRLIAVSEAVRTAWVAAGWPDSAATVIHNPVPLPPAERLPGPKLSGPGPRIALVASLEPWKGHTIFLRAAAVVRQQFPTATFYVVGAETLANPGYREEIVRLVRELDLERSVVLTGAVGDVLGLMREMDAIVHASTSPEPFGNVIVEAMYCGRPVVAADAGGPQEIVTHGRDGLLYPPGDHSALAVSLTELLSNRTLAANLAQSGTLTATVRFGLDAFRSRLAEEYHRAIAGTANGPLAVPPAVSTRPTTKPRATPAAPSGT